MGIIGTILVGGLIGWLASLIAKTNAQMGCLWNVIIGVAGAALGHWIAMQLFGDVNIDKFSIKGILVGVGGAVVLIMALRMIGIMKKG